MKPLLLPSPQWAKLGSAFLALALLASCGSDDPASSVIVIPPPVPVGPDGDGQGGGVDAPSSPSAYLEPYRPQIHYTPARNWMNDPNGMVYADGTWHLYYQYNPYGNDWGNMSWGHARSADLVHWQECPVALRPDALGDVFSGSAVVDHANTAGFGADAIVALYTSAGQHQQQSLAYSTDGGMTFQPYEGNPVIGNTTRGDFRDPKVFWHEGSHQWVMSLALGWEYGVEFWTSRDLKTWRMASQFHTDALRCNKGQWECPDLIQIDYEGQPKWVMLVSVNPGGPHNGSGTMYFVGDFDGTTFRADALDYPLWLDYGMDNYAGVTWSNAPGGRHVLLGWMNNWAYAGSVPCSPWRSAFTLPRQLSLISYQGQPLLSSRVAPEVDALAGPWQPLQTGASQPLQIGAPGSELNAYHVQVTLPLAAASVITLSNDKGEQCEMRCSPIGQKLSVQRTSLTGACCQSFSMPAVNGPLRTEGPEVTLDVYVDQSSVEVFTATGSMAMTNLVFPQTIYDRITFGREVTAARYRTFQRIW